MVPILLRKASRNSKTRQARLAILASLLAQLCAPNTSHANPFYEAGCRNAVTERYPGRFKQETIGEYCRCQNRNRGKDQDVCIAILSKEAKSQRLSNSEEYTIGAMTAVICAKRLGRLSNSRANEALLMILLEQNLPLVLGTREDLWVEAYKDVGEGTEWCIKNQ
jgi:hypothetical protein